MSVVRKSRGAVMAYDPTTRWKARAWALVAYLLVLAAVGAIVLFALRYQPISSADFASVVPQADPNVARVDYTAGGTFSFGFLVVNDGPLPVKIQRIQTMTGRNGLLVPVRLETAGKRYAGSLSVGDPSLEKFLPFTLAGGDRRWIVVRTRFANCGSFDASDSRSYMDFQVTYSVLGLTKHASVPLPKEIKVDSPPDYACPTRTA